ncbi:hypothetical protein KW882_01090 [Vibrio parahaemolyticus]
MRLPPNVKKARLSADALAKSFNLSSDRGRELLASCYEIKGWNSFCEKISTQPDTNQLDPTEQNQINEILMAKISSRLSIPQSKYLKQVIESCSPFSQKPKVLVFDIAAAQESHDDGVNIGEMFDMLDMNEGFEQLMDMIGADSGDPEFFEDIKAGGLDEFQQRMRLSKPLEPFFFLLAIDKITEWKTSDKSNGFEHGVPAFYYFDEHDEEHPVFLNSACVMAGDTGDIDTLNSLIHIASAGYDEEFEKPIILFGSAPHKEINGKTFSTIGIWFDGMSWRWLFLCKEPPWRQKALFPEGVVDGLENTLISPAPPSELASGTESMGLPSHHVYHCLCNPIEDPTTDDEHGFNFNLEPRYELSAATGWKVFI